MATRVASLGLGIVVLLAAVAFAASREPSAFAGAATAAKRIDKPVTLMARPRVVLESGEIALSERSGPEAAWDFLSGTGPSFVLTDATLTVDATPGGSVEANVDAIAADGSAPVEMGRAWIRNGAIVFRGPGGDTRLDGVAAFVEAKSGGAYKARGTFGYKGEALTFLSVVAPADDAEPSRFGIKLDVTGRLINAKLGGALALGAEPEYTADDSEIRLPDGRAFARWMGGEPPPGAGLRNVSLRGRLDWTPSAVAMRDATIATDGNEATGNLAMAIRDGRPVLDATLAFDRLNVTPYLGARRAEAAAWLRGFDADARVSAESITARGELWGRAAATLSLEKGRLKAEMAELALANGATGETEVTVDLSGETARVSCRGRLEGVDGEAATSALFGQPWLDGRVQTSFDLAGAGDTATGIVKTLAGRVEFELADRGQVRLDLSTAPSIDAAASWRDVPIGKGSTAVDWLLGRFTIKDGVAKAQAITAGVGGKQLSASGFVDLPARTLHMTLGVAPRIGAASAASAAPSPWLSIAGPWSDLRLSAAGSPKAQRSAEPSILNTATR